MTTTPIHQASKTETYEVIATISGAKAHRVIAATLLEDGLSERVVRMKFVPGVGYEEVTEPVIIPAGTEVYYSTACGTARHAGEWKVYENHYRKAEKVTCAKCSKA